MGVMRTRGATGREASLDRVDQALSRLTTEITNEVNWQLHECKLTRADLAARMGVSPGRISQILSGDENLTLRTLASLAVAIDARFEVRLRPYQPGQASSSDVDVHPADASGQPTGSDHGPHVEPSWRRRVRRSAQSQVGGATQAH